jgi:subtilisin family serine protease
MIRQVMVVNRDDFLDLLPAGTKAEGAEQHKHLSLIEQRLRDLLGKFRGPLEILGMPSTDWQVRLTRTQDLPRLERLVIGIGIKDLSEGVPNVEGLKNFRKAVEDTNKGAIGDGKPSPILGVGADLSLAGTEYFCPATVDELLFGDRNAAATLTGSGVLKQRGLTGRGVNVVVIDQGFDATKVRNFGGGLAIGGVEPGTTTRGHGLMLIRNIADAAPDATFYDVPLIPARISNVMGFLCTALNVFNQLQQLIEFLRTLSNAQWGGPWVLVNAWSIFDRSTEMPPGDYTGNLNHPLNLVVDAMAGHLIDLVFAAGNCGQFCPDRRCGKRDIGPANSIFGANSHPRVLTTGAVRTDTRWLGGSSQGPGLLAPWKPDLCAPSCFREVGDAFVGNLNEPFVGDTGSPYIASTGTSAACGLAAGIVAAIRSGWGQTILSPDDLRQALNENARKTEGPGWKEHLGNGIIDVKATLSALRVVRT